MCVLWRNMISTTTVGNAQGRKYQLLNGQAKVEVSFILVSTKGAHLWSKLLSDFFKFYLLLLFFKIYLLLLLLLLFFFGGGGGVRDPPTQSAEDLRVACLQNGIFSTYITSRCRYILVPCMVT